MLDTPARRWAWGLEGAADFVGDHVGVLGQEELARVGLGRHPVAAFAFGRGAVEGVEAVVEGERGGGDVELPVGEVGEVHRLGQPHLAVVQGALGGGETPLLLDLLQGALHHRGQAVEDQVVLHQIVAGAELHHLDGDAFIAVAGDDDEGLQGAGRAQFVDQRLREAIRQGVVDEQEVDLVCGQPGVALPPARDPGAAEAGLFEQVAEELGEALVVLDDQDAEGGGDHGAESRGRHRRRPAEWAKRAQV